MYNPKNLFPEGTEFSKKCLSGQCSSECYFDEKCPVKDKPDEQEQRTAEEDHSDDEAR